MKKKRVKASIILILEALFSCYTCHSGCAPSLHSPHHLHVLATDRHNPAAAVVLLAGSYQDPLTSLPCTTSLTKFNRHPDPLGHRIALSPALQTTSAPQQSRSALSWTASPSETFPLSWSIATTINHVDSFSFR